MELQLAGLPVSTRRRSMTSFSIVLILIGLFILINAFNIVGVIQGNKTFSPLAGTTTPTPTSTPTAGGSGGVKLA
jgi:hypothetical protein